MRSGEVNSSSSNSTGGGSSSSNSTGGGSSSSEARLDEVKFK